MSLTALKEVASNANKDGRHTWTPHDFQAETPKSFRNSRAITSSPLSSSPWILLMCFRNQILCQPLGVSTIAWCLAMAPKKGRRKGLASKKRQGRTETVEGPLAAGGRPGLLQRSPTSTKSSPHPMISYHAQRATGHPILGNSI